METRILIDAIVRQTTVLVASLSTAAGLRAPLAHLADQVFLDVAREIESQGVGRKVVADMFGLALRGYQKRVQRLMETRADQQVTLWSAVLEYVTDHAPVTRGEVFRRFRHDEEPQVAAVLNDLVASRVLSRQGRGLDCEYAVTPEAEYRRLADAENARTAEWLVWVSVYRNPGSTLADICTRTSLESTLVSTSLASLVASGRVQERPENDGLRYAAETLTVPVGSRVGWEAAVFDHFQAMCTAIAVKTRSRVPGSRTDDTVGGATLGFDIYPGHPFETQVHELLQRVRADVNVLWNDVRAFNAANPVPDEQKTRVVFYMGQYVQQTDYLQNQEGNPVSDGVESDMDEDAERKE